MYKIKESHWQKGCQASTFTYLNTRVLKHGTKRTKKVTTTEQHRSSDQQGCFSQLIYRFLVQFLWIQPWLWVNEELNATGYIYNQSEKLSTWCRQSDNQSDIQRISIIMCSEGGKPVSDWFCSEDLLIGVVIRNSATILVVLNNGSWKLPSEKGCSCTAGISLVHSVPVEMTMNRKGTGSISPDKCFCKFMAGWDKQTHLCLLSLTSWQFHSGASVLQIYSSVEVNLTTSVQFRAPLSPHIITHLHHLLQVLVRQEGQ